MELAALRLRPHLRLEVLDAPDLHAGLLAAVVPRGSVEAACFRGALRTSVQMPVQLESFGGTPSPSNFFSIAVQKDEDDRHQACTDALQKRELAQAIRELGRSLVASATIFPAVAVALSPSSRLAVFASKSCTFCDEVMVEINQCCYGGTTVPGTLM